MNREQVIQVVNNGLINPRIEHMDKELNSQGRYENVEFMAILEEIKQYIQTNLK